MAIVKMKAVTISAKINEFDYVAEKYIYGRDIHLEKASSVLTNRKRLENFEDSNIYETLGKDALSILKFANYEVDPSCIADNNMTSDMMQAYIDNINKRIENERTQNNELSKQIEDNEKTISQMNLMLEVDEPLEQIFGMEYVSVRFGHISKASYKTLTTYLENLETVFVKTSEDVNTVWGFYFVPILKKRKVDEVFDSLYFEEDQINTKEKGIPYDIKKNLERLNEELKKQMRELSNKTSSLLADSRSTLSGIYNLAKKRNQFDEIRRNAVHSDMFFYIVGWMDEHEAKKLEKEIASSSDVVIMYVEDPRKLKHTQPPTKLKNNFIFRPFEMFVKMYGLPMYGELDPTPILAITYIIFFGIMFGDVGQSAILAIGGFLIYKLKKLDLGGIIGMVGLAGIVTGFLYGSVFGNEEIIPRLFHIQTIKPMEEIMPLLIGTVCMGAFIIIMGMFINVRNMLHDKQYGDALFGHNGVAGIMFYVGVLLVALNAIIGIGIPKAVFIVIFAVSLLAMYMCTPFTRLIEGNKNWFPRSGMYFVENFFELFEVILSFVTNTISFLRIGAFAVIHVGMMMAVAALAKGGGAGGLIVQIVGNIIVMVLEALIVAIQVLRLEYYEMFSRYFRGGGKEFVSLKNK